MGNDDGWSVRSSIWTQRASKQACQYYLLIIQQQAEELQIKSSTASTQTKGKKCVVPVDYTAGYCQYHHSSALLMLPTSTTNKHHHHRQQPPPPPKIHTKAPGHRATDNILYAHPATSPSPSHQTIDARFDINR